MTTGLLVVCLLCASDLSVLLACVHPVSVRVPKKGFAPVFIEQYRKQDGKEMENPLSRSLVEFYRDEVTLLTPNSTQNFKQMLPVYIHMLLPTLMINTCLTSGCFQSVGRFNI